MKSVQVDIEAMMSLHDRLALEFEPIASRSNPFHGFLEFSRHMFFEALGDDAFDVVECVAVPAGTGDNVVGLRISRDFEARMALAAKNWFGPTVV